MNIRNLIKAISFVSALINLSSPVKALATFEVKNQLNSHFKNTSKNEKNILRKIKIVDQNSLNSFKDNSKINQINNILNSYSSMPTQLYNQKNFIMSFLVC